MILYSKNHPTGFMFKSMVAAGDPDIFYFRRGSAASTLCKADVWDLDYIKYDAIHMTGITPALSESAREATAALLQRARENNILFSFDPNLRPQLWPNREAMADYINGMAAKSDIFLPGVKEAKIILGKQTRKKSADTILTRAQKPLLSSLAPPGLIMRPQERAATCPDSRWKPSWIPWAPATDLRRGPVRPARGAVPQGSGQARMCDRGDTAHEQGRQRRASLQR
jgi:sugar/nucleoside kinase (ribokinase family)